MRQVMFGILLLLAGPAAAYEVSTHQAITTEAGDRSIVDAILKDNLGVSGGLETVVRGQQLTEWLGQGARREDDFIRFLNHFHNPLADWSAAGLLGSVGQSSILWGQNASLSGWSWQDVRAAYFDALTRSVPSDREAGLAKAFEGLGRQVHLVQDAASPAHARNDPHALYNFESLVDQARRQDQNAFSSWLAGSPDAPGVPEPGWQFLDGNPLAPIATARLVDADRYLGANPGATTASLIGMAEYTNANFFSEDRIFTENDADAQKRFPYPNRASVTEQDFDVQVGGSTVKRRYFVKTADGATGYRLATVGLLRDYHQRFNLDWTRFRESPALDEGVYRDYAARLLPRAVAYSIALLDYFFRGRVNTFGSDQAFGLENLTDEAMEGIFTLYYDDAGDVRRPVPGASWTRTLASAGAAEDLALSPPVSPPAKEPGKYMLVFRGRLGSEPDAVVGRQVFIEPVLIARLVKRSDGEPHRGVVVQAIDVQSGDVLGSELTDQDGRARLGWRPGRTVLFIPNVNLFPMYWAGGSAFSSTVEGGRVVQTTDLDAQRQVTIPVPLIAAAWPERIEACTEVQLFAHTPRGIFQRSVPLGDDRFDFVSVTYGVNLITFIRADNGWETELCGETSPGCVDPRAAFVAEDVNRVGQVVGQLVRDVRSTHFRQIIDADGRPIGPHMCAAEYAEVEEVPVTVAEE
ncbi:MAG TPA: hypothetical protein VLK35_06780 [Methylomirabilota bacterium]|nr:hypothetical protein [Methylomirabilota bacterium]